LIITDIFMPKMRGDELYTAIKVLNLSPEPRFIFVSGYEKRVIEAQLEADLGAQVEFISKPFSPTAIVSKVKGVFSK